MLPEERRLEITKIINKNGSSTAKRLSEIFNVSLMTINRDLRKLEKDNKIKTSRGGAISKNKILTETLLSQRLNFNLEEKQSISEDAIKFIKSGDIILLDSSSTSIILSRKLVNSDLENLTIVTNSIVIINELASCINFTVLGTGGVVNNKFNCFIGSIAEETVSKLKVNKFFFSVGALSLNGELTDADNQEANLKKKMIEASNENILMIESYKFDKIGLYKVIDLQEVDLIISDCGVYTKRKDEFKNFRKNLLAYHKDIKSNDESHQYKIKL